MSATKSMRWETLIVTISSSLFFLCVSWRSSAHLGMSAEIGGADRFIAPEFVGLAAEHDPPRLQNVAVICDRQSHARVLLDKQDRGGAADLGYDAEHRLHDDGRKAQRRFVEQEQPRLGHEPARNRDHLQLAAGQGPAERVGEDA